MFGSTGFRPPLRHSSGAVTITAPPKNSNAAGAEADSTAVVAVEELGRRRLWRACVEHLKAELPLTTWATWLANSVLVEAADGRYVIGIGQQMGVDWIAQRYLSAIGDAIARQTGHRGRLTVELIVVDGLALPEADDAPTVVEVEIVRPPREGDGHDRARIENNLGRKAIFALQGKRGPNVGTVTV
ncbi:MAG: hypothetical protein JOZ75_13340, partial [Candidatus Dormibacteraeota bacterium]|nr:hypothetical protein [Candidatus Dormibacteraeota bacterium]